ncbi:hypothetical protein M513_12409 [Trichuris suis]|uniref:Uncharacterized protein n=1 Tax=Trichuris suis TaxID=68888 RepID=A0A085LP03_9BILA|nr:hypothetical protein M513_12409 [Trichuris suis]
MPQRNMRTSPYTVRPHPSQTGELNLDRIVVNLSTSPLNEQDKDILSKGENFVPTPKNLPLVDIIASVEHSLSSVDPQKAYG